MVLFVGQLAHIGDGCTVVAHCVFDAHHLLVAFLTRHQFLDHYTVALVHRRLIRIPPVYVIQRLIGEVPHLRLVVAKLRLLVWKFGQLEHVRANDALGAILVRQSSGRNHRMV